MKKIKELIKKYKQIISYVIVGGFTTLISFGLYYFPGIRSLHYIAANTIAWICAVIFSFFANRRFVFESKSRGVRAVTLEFAGFVASRLFSLFAEDAILYILVAVGSGRNIAKLPAAIIVVILNYITGHFVFSEHGGKKKNEAADKAEA